MSITSLRGVQRLEAVTGEPKRITVIGAGIAGLVAAYELEQLGHQVDILEGSLEIGGRIRTHRFHANKAGPFAELGAMRIPIDHSHTMHYIAELGLHDHIREFKTLFSDDAAYLATSTGYVRVRDAPDVLVKEFSAGLGHQRYKENTFLFGAWLDASVKAIAPQEFREGLRNDLCVGLLNLVDHIDLAPYLCGSAKNKINLHAFFADHPQVQLACAGRLDRFLDDLLSETSSTVVRLRKGMDTITQRLASRIRGPISCGQEVLGLDVREHDVLVRVRQGVKILTRSCDYVLCTIPFTVLRTMHLKGFDKNKLEIIHQTKYWPTTKIAFHCREAFWEKDGITGGASFTAGHVRQTYYPPVEGDPALGAVLLASYTIGADADALSRLGRPGRDAVIMEELSAVHPELRRPGMVLNVVSQAWGEHRWSKGAATVRWGQDAATREAEQREAARPQKRLFFAGEHCSSKPAWIEGAIESAIEAVYDIEWHKPEASRAFVAGRLSG